MHPLDTMTEKAPSTAAANDSAFAIIDGTNDAAAPAEKVEDLRELLERQKRTFDLAMTASQMGTWRYTVADNICEYDENAQRLYGLTEARFLHDADGVKSKFHAEDLDLLWSRVATAFDAQGDGRYDVEYRVKQQDGSWRWLSAWGHVEFDGEGADRKPIAITGASRDITERKEAERLQRLLLDELKHRVKNTLATVHAVATQTLATAPDLSSAREALDQRIVLMAKAHDLLIARSWTGASLKDVVTSALEPFSPTQVQISGDDVHISSRQTLAFSMALHELATNAAKYGALSCPEGRVSLDWAIDGERLQLEWQESGGPPVEAPTRKGFGSRLLQRLVIGELDGEVNIDYAIDGVRCTIETVL